MGNEKLWIIAIELFHAACCNSSMDWWRKVSVRKKVRCNIRRILRKHGFQPDL